MANENLVRQMTVEWSGMPQPAREKLLSGLLAYKASRNVQGASLVTDPKFAEILGALQDDESLDAAIEALMRLEKSREQRESAGTGARPTEVSVALFASTSTALDESDAGRYVREILGARYGDESLGVREFQFVTIPDLDPSLTLNEDVARAYYSRLVELPQGRDFGEVDDAYAGTARDGTPIAALFFWHGSTGGKKRRRFFGRG